MMAAFAAVWACCIVQHTAALSTSPKATVQLNALGTHYVATLVMPGGVSLPNVVIDAGSSSVTVKVCSQDATGLQVPVYV